MDPQALKKRSVIRFVDAGVQRRLMAGVLTCVGVTVAAATCATIYGMDALASELPHDGELVAAKTVALGVRAGMLALVVSLPALLLLLLAATMPVAGVSYRFRQFLTEVVAGSRVEPLSLRRGDPMQAFATLLNAATEETRRRNGEAAADPEPRDHSRAA